METQQKTFKVVFTSILALPDSRERDILTRKTLALRAGFKTTATLRKHDIKDEEDAYQVLSMLSESMTGLVVDSGTEPMDPSDKGDDPVSLEAFARRAEAEEAEVAASVTAKVRQLVKGGQWAEAAEVAVSGFADLGGRHKRKMVALLGMIAEHEPRAAVFYGQALITGEGIRQDFDRGYAILMDLTGDDDANTAGYAHMQLGQALVEVPGRGYEALRHFEGAAYLGWEDGSESAGVLCQLGSEGAPFDFDRAARNFRYGIAKGHAGCMTKYALMILSGQVEYDPCWQQYYDAALDKKDSVALYFYGTVLDAQEKAAGDLAAFLDAFRAKFNTQIGAAVSIDAHDYGLSAE